MDTVSKICKELRTFATPERAKASAWFFKTGKGEYGEGDIFWGITVPEQRRVAKVYRAEASFADLQQLLKSKVHEHRFTALEMLVMKYEDAGKKFATENEQKKIYRFYLTNTQYINNWDLVDTSAAYIVGDFLLKGDRRVLYRLAGSKNLWERRIAIVATGALIQKNQYSDTLKMAKILLADRNDLIHKAVGWMLREVGKRDKKKLLGFLDKHAGIMPRTMLRYAIERLPQSVRKKYLKQKTLPARHTIRARSTKAAAPLQTNIVE